VPAPALARQAWAEARPVVVAHLMAATAVDAGAGHRLPCHAPRRRPTQLHALVARRQPRPPFCERLSAPWPDRQAELYRLYGNRRLRSLVRAPHSISMAHSNPAIPSRILRVSAGVTVDVVGAAVAGAPEWLVALLLPDFLAKAVDRPEVAPIARAVRTRGVPGLVRGLPHLRRPRSFEPNEGPRQR
jgi:hypothetical protein